MVSSQTSAVSASTVSLSAARSSETSAQTPEAHGVPGRGDPAPAPNPLPAYICISDARLPVTYEQAKTALAPCSRIDECQEWANKAEALASYARQAAADSRRKLAGRIQTCPIRRCRELLGQFDGHGGDRTKSDGGGTSAPSRREAAENTSLSKRQQVTAGRVANVPAHQFKQAVESEEPPPVTALAEVGKQSRSSPAQPPAYDPIETTVPVLRMSESGTCGGDR